MRFGYILAGAVFFRLAPLAAQDGVRAIPLSVSDVKWTYLKFPANVCYVEKGTEDIDYEATGVKSIVRLRGQIPYFDSTAVTAITTDGRMYTYRLGYEQNPPYSAVDMRNVGDSIRRENIISPYIVELSQMKTTHIVLDDNKRIVDVSVGSDSIIAQRVEGMRNIVVARAVGDFDNFTETSLTIVTDDRRVYPIDIRSNPTPKDINVRISDGGTAGEKATFSLSMMNEVDMEEYGRAAVERGVVLNNIGEASDRMLFTLRGLFIKDDILMFHLYAYNKSNIPYEIDFIRSYIKNKKKGKKQTSQDDEKVPVFVYKTEEKDVIDGGGGYSAVFFFKGFTVPDKHLFYFEIFEKNGGRHLKFTASNREILRAKDITLGTETDGETNK